MGSVLERLILPPGGPLVLMVAGWLLLRRGGAGRRRTGRGLLALGVLALYLASAPVVARPLLRTLETHAAWDGEAGDLQAIVLLGADISGPTPELGDVTLGPLALERARWAAAVQRRTGLPLLVSGGVLRANAPAEAELYRRYLEGELAVPVAWVEGRSRDTQQNALFSAELLAASGIRRIGLVTHAFHMRRAERHFRARGLEVVPMPTAFHGPVEPLPGSLLPSSRALRETALAGHEWAGTLWATLRGW